MSCNQEKNIFFSWLTLKTHIQKVRCLMRSCASGKRKPHSVARVECISSSTNPWLYKTLLLAISVTSLYLSWFLKVPISEMSYKSLLVCLLFYLYSLLHTWFFYQCVPLKYVRVFGWKWSWLSVLFV